MEAFEHAADGGTMPAALVGVFGYGREQLDAQVGVTEAVEQMLALAQDLEQGEVGGTGRIKAGVGALILAQGFAQAFEIAGRLLYRLRQGLYGGQCLQIAVVGVLAGLLVTIEVAYALVPGDPGHDLLAVAFPAAADLEFTGVIDDGFDAQHAAHFVIHFDPVAFHAVFDPRALLAVFLAVRQDFPIELGVEFPAQEAQNIGGLEVQDGMIHQTRIQFGKLLGIAEDQVGGEFGLVDDPTVGHARQDILQGWQHAQGQLPQACGRKGVQEATGELLGFDWVVDLHERVVVLFEGHLFPAHLLSQVVVAVDGDLDGQGNSVGTRMWIRPNWESR